MAGFKPAPRKAFQSFYQSGEIQMRVLANPCYGHPIAVVVILASTLAAMTLHAEDSTVPKLDSRIKMIPHSPLHGLAADGEILSVIQTRLVIVGKTYYGDRQYLTVIKLPTGEVLEKIAIALPIEEMEHTTGSQDGSRIAILQGDTIEIRDVITAGEVKHHIAAKAGKVTSVALSNDGVMPRRQTLLKVISCPDAKILWEQWLPGEINKLNVSPQGEYVLLSMFDRWFVVDAG